jgi:hypothetical protein
MSYDVPLAVWSGAAAAFYRRHMYPPPHMTHESSSSIGAAAPVYRRMGACARCGHRATFVLLAPPAG